MRFILINSSIRQNVIRAIQNAPDGACVDIRDKPRSLDQNDAMWPVLDAFSKQVKWPVDGELIYISSEEWKDIFTAAFEGEIKIAKGLNGGSVMLGRRTSKYGKKKFSELLEFMHAEAVNRGVVLHSNSGGRHVKQS